MASNIVNWQNYYAIPAGTTSVTFGIGPGLITPARLVESFVTGSVTINLPPISGYAPQPPTTSQQVQGVFSSFEMTIFNTGAGTITVTPYNTSPETDVSLPSTISVGSSANNSTTIIAMAATNTWYVYCTH